MASGRSWAILGSTRRAVERALDDLPLEHVTSVGELVDAVSLSYGKPIYLEPLDPDQWGALTGFLAEVDDEVVIYYRLQDSPQYRLQCICHELGHLVMGTECSRAFDVTLARQVSVPEGAIRLQARDLRDTPPERYAEEFAFAAILRLRAAGRPATRDAEIWA